MCFNRIHQNVLKDTNDPHVDVIGGPADKVISTQEKLKHALIKRP